MPPNKEMIGSDEKTGSKWNMPVPDMIRMVLERLNFEAFHKARSISLYWYSIAESCIRQNPTPWLILFPAKNNGSCKLFDPHHKKSYLIRDLGFDLSTSRCLANSGSWLLMLDHRTSLYLLNLFTRERINFPSLETINGGEKMRVERVGESDLVVIFGQNSISKSNRVRIRKAVLWVDERSRDYLVVCNFDNYIAYYHKKGDNNESWKVLKPLKNEGCADMVFKDDKLYRLSGRTITVFNFYCGDSPMVCASFNTPDWYDLKNFKNYNLAVTLSGEVLIVSRRYSVSKMDPESSKWSRIRSLGDEALLLDQGITVAAKDGVMKNCIYISKHVIYEYTWCIPARDDDNGICVYNIQTNKKVQMFQHLSDSSQLLFKDARWFFPTFGGKWLL